MNDGSYIQVTPTQIVHVRSHLGSEFKNTQWTCNQGTKITAACSNKRQVVIQQGSDQLIYFELDQMQGNLLTDRSQKIFKQASITSLDLADVPEGR